MLYLCRYAQKANARYRIFSRYAKGEEKKSIYQDNFSFDN